MRRPDNKPWCDGNYRHSGPLYISTSWINLTVRHISMLLHKYYLTDSVVLAISLMAANYSKTRLSLHIDTLSSVHLDCCIYIPIFYFVTLSPKLLFVNLASFFAATNNIMSASLTDFISKIFSTWTVLRLAQQHSTGGRDTSAKIQNLTSFVLHSLDKHTVEEDLAEMLEDYLNDKLDILCEDDSQYDVARLIVQAHSFSIAGKTSELAELIKELPSGCNMTECASQVISGGELDEGGDSFSEGDDDEDNSSDEEDVEMDGEF